jgi:hypothetical protein
MFYSIMGILVLRAFFQIFGSNAGEAAYAKILKHHEGSFNKANATKTLLGGLAAMGASMAAGRFIDYFNDPVNGFGALAGNTWAFGVAAAAMGLASAFYAFFFRDAALSSAAVSGGKWQAFKAKAGDYGEGFKKVFQIPFMRNSILTSLVSIAAGDAMTMMVLPQYLKDLSGGAEGGFGTLMAASAAGSTVAALLMMMWSNRSAKKDPDGAALAKEGRISYIMAGISALSTWGLLLAPSVSVASIIFGVKAVLSVPAGVLWSSYLLRALKSEKANMGKIFAALSVIFPVGTALGSYFFGWYLSGKTTADMMNIYMVVMTLNGLSDFLGSYLLFKKEIPPTPPTQNGGAEKPLAGVLRTQTDFGILS